MWNFACSHHFAGSWDGEGGKAKTHCLNSKENLHNAQLCVQHLNKTFTRTANWDGKTVWNVSATTDAASSSSYKINQRHFIHSLSGAECRKDEKDADTIPGLLCV